MQKLGPWVSVRFGAVLQHLTGPSGSLWRNRARHRQWRETANPANEAEANRFPKRNFGSVTVTVAPGASRWPTFGKNFWVHIAVLEPQNIPKCQGWQLMAMSKYVKWITSPQHRLETSWKPHGPMISLRDETLGDSLVKHITKTSPARKAQYQRFLKMGVSQSKIRSWSC